MGMNWKSKVIWVLLVGAGAGAGSFGYRLVADMGTEAAFRGGGLCHSADGVNAASSGA